MLGFATSAQRFSS